MNYIKIQDPDTQKVYYFGLPTDDYTFIAYELKNDQGRLNPLITVMRPFTAPFTLEKFSFECAAKQRVIVSFYDNNDNLIRMFVARLNRYRVVMTQDQNSEECLMLDILKELE